MQKRHGKHTRKVGGRWQPLLEMSSEGSEGFREEIQGKSRYPPMYTVLCELPQPHKKVNAWVSKVGIQRINQKIEI